MSILTMDRHDTVTDMDIQALVDNELGWEEEKRVRSHLAGDPHAKARYEMLRQQKALLKAWWNSRKSH